MTVEENKLYGKTKRYNPNTWGCTQVTEKMNGSNLCFYVKNDILYIAQRNYTYSILEIDSPEVKGIVYNGLYDWLKLHADQLKNDIYSGSCVMGEWVSNRYDESILGFYMFGKARMVYSASDDSTKLESKVYDYNTFKYVFNNQLIPNYIKPIPLVDVFARSPSLDDLNVLYDSYRESVNRNVEGFVLCMLSSNNISKYVRMKDSKNKIIDHFWDKE